MKDWGQRLHWRQRLLRWARRAYRYSELRKLLLWLKGRSLHWVLYLALAALISYASLGLHNFMYNHFYVVMLGNREIGYVREAGEIEAFLDGLTEQCSTLYGMPVDSREKLSLKWEYCPGREANAEAVKEFLRRQITLVTEAVMVVIEETPVLAVASHDEVEEVVRLLCEAYTSTADNVVLLEASLLEEVKGEACRVTPEEVFPAEDVARLLLAETDPDGRLLLSRDATLDPGAEDEEDSAGGNNLLPQVHVLTVEEETVEESVPFQTEYRYTDSLWVVQSRVVTPGKEGTMKVVYQVTRENGQELERKKISEELLEAPVSQVVEKGTATVPAMGTGQFIWPVKGGGRLTQGFRGWGHAGIDISYSSRSSRYSTSILAADSGVVVHTGSQYPMGNHIVIYHGNYFTVYLHNQEHYVSKGDTVSRGQVIALMGNTGRTVGLDGIHLHFEVRVNDGTGVWNHWRQHQPVDPLKFFRK